MPPKEDWEKYKAPVEEETKEEKPNVPLTEGDIQVLKTYVCIFCCHPALSNEDGSKCCHLSLIETNKPITGGCTIC